MRKLSYEFNHKAIDFLSKKHLSMQLCIFQILENLLSKNMVG